MRTLHRARGPSAASRCWAAPPPLLRQSRPTFPDKRRIQFHLQEDRRPTAISHDNMRSSSREQFIAGKGRPKRVLAWPRLFNKRFTDVTGLQNLLRLTPVDFHSGTHHD